MVEISNKNSSIPGKSTKISQNQLLLSGQSLRVIGRLSSPDGRRRNFLESRGSDRKNRLARSGRSRGTIFLCERRCERRGEKKGTDLEEGGEGRWKERRTITKREWKKGTDGTRPIAWRYGRAPLGGRNEVFSAASAQGGAQLTVNYLRRHYQRLRARPGMKIEGKPWPGLLENSLSLSLSLPPLSQFSTAEIPLRFQLVATNFLPRLRIFLSEIVGLP